MSNIKNWSKTPASNNATPPDGMPEGQLPSTVNDSARQRMADHRTQWEDAEWFDWGHVLTRQSANSFLVSLAATGIYTAGRRLKMYDTTTIYGEVLASSPSGANTLVTVSSSSLSTSLSSVGISIFDPTNRSIPASGAAPTYLTTASLTGQTGVIITGIPPWARRVDVMFYNLRNDTTSSTCMVQLGDSGGIEGGADGMYSYFSGVAVATAGTSNGFVIDASMAGGTRTTGICSLRLVDPTTNRWVGSVQSANDTVTRMHHTVATKATSAVMDRIQIITQNSTFVFQDGIVVVSYE